MTEANAATYKTAETAVKLKYIPALDGLRGIAILLVIAYHYFNQFTFFHLGWTGVDLFFVLSGFLITKRLMENKDLTNRYALFYKNRALRILPLYYLVLVIFYICIYFLVSPQNLNRFDIYVNNKPAFFLFLQNWVFIINDNLKERHLEPFWSLAVEEQFYLIWPLFLYTFYSNKYFRKILFSILAGTVLIRTCLYFFSIKNLYWNTFCRIDALIIGALTWLLLQKPLPAKKVIWFGICALLVLTTAYLITKDMRPRSPFSVTAGYTVFALLFASVIYTVVMLPASRITSFLKNSFLRFTGKISYGMYVIHFPVILLIGPKISAILKASNLPVNLIRGVICLLITYAISIFSYYFFESYFLKRKSTTA